MGEISFGLPPNYDNPDKIGNQQINAKKEELIRQKLSGELIKPVNIVAEVKSLFEQYALPDKKYNPDFSTPEISLSKAQFIEDFSNTIFISHISDLKDVFAIMNSNPNVNDFFTLPVLTLEGGDNATVYGKEFKPLAETDELREARELIEFLKFRYRNMVRENADTIKLTKYLNPDSRKNVDAAMLFYFAGQNPLIDYKPAIIDVVFPQQKPAIVLPETPLNIVKPSQAFTEAIETFYAAYGETPTQHSPSQVEFKGVEILVDDDILPISYSDMPYFTGLFRELTVFDNDRDLVDKVLRHMTDEPNNLNN